MSSESTSCDSSLTKTLSSMRHKKETTEAYLIRLTLDLLAAFDQQRYDEVLSADFLAPAYQAQLEARRPKPRHRNVPGNPPVDLETLVQYHAELAELYPDRHIRPVESNAVMDKHHLSGQVFVNVELTGHPPGVLYTGVLVSEWRWLHSKWLCVRQTSMRGIGVVRPESPPTDRHGEGQAKPD